MKILITGANGFIGKNLVAQLKNRGYEDLFLCNRETTKEQMNYYTSKCNFVFHLAGVNRTENQEDFMKGNLGFTSDLLELLKNNHNNASMLVTSSIQAIKDNPYGKSKRAGEELLLKYEQEVNGSNIFDNHTEIIIYRLPNVFGKWSKPNYNSAVATFCHNIARNLPIVVNDMEHLMNLVYIDDVVDTFISAMEEKETPAMDGLYYIMKVHSVKLGEIADLLYSFRKMRSEGIKSENIDTEGKFQSDNLFLQVPDMSNQFVKKLYSTYLSFLPVDQFSYGVKMNIDKRGSFTELIKSIERGQVSVNISKPGITKGNHWHHTKNEKFIVVSGEGVIRFRKIDEDKVIEYKVNGDKIQVVDIPPGYTHNITNIGDSDMVTIMWANELFDMENPDTYFMEV